MQEILNRIGVIARYNVINKQIELLIPDVQFSIDNQPMLRLHTFYRGSIGLECPQAMFKILLQLLQTMTNITLLLIGFYRKNGIKNRV